MRAIECPCCRGKIYLEVIRTDMPNSPTQYEICGHCHGTGKSEADEFYLLNGLWLYDDPPIKSWKKNSKK